MCLQLKLIYEVFVHSISNNLGSIRNNFNSSASVCPPTPVKKRRREFLPDCKVEVQKGNLEVAAEIFQAPSKKMRLSSLTSEEGKYTDYFDRKSPEVFAEPSPRSFSYYSAFPQERTVRPGEFLEWANALAPSSEPQRMLTSPAEDNFVSTEGMFAGEFEEVSQASFAGKSEISEREDIFRDEMRVRRRPADLARQIRQRKEVERKNLPRFISRAQEYQEDLLEVIKDDPRIKSIGDFLGKGSFVDAYSIQFKKEKQVIKIPHFRTAKPGADGINTLKILAYELKQYIQLKDAGFPINDHYNFDEFLSQGENRELYREGSPKNPILLDHLKTHFKDAFYRVEFVPYELNHKAMIREYNEKALQLGPEDLAAYQNELKETNHPLYQIKEMFQFAWVNDIPLDLQASNLRIKADKTSVTVVLCDLYYKDHSFSMIIEQALATFGSNSPICDYFRPQGHLGGNGLAAASAPLARRGSSL